MVYKSPFPELSIPRCNILSYLFPENERASDEALWIDSEDPATSLSPAGVLGLVKRFAVGLDRLGVAEGQVIMVMTPNHIYVSIVYLGAAGSKRCFTGVNPAFTEEEIAYQMKAVDVAMGLIHPTVLEAGIGAAKRAGIPLRRLYLFSKDPHTKSHGIADWWSILVPTEAARQWKWGPLPGTTSSSTIAVVNFSSGTTGLPKGVCITHHNLVANTAQTISVRSHGLDKTIEGPSSERWINFLPFYHAFSQLWMINMTCKLRIPVYVMKKFHFEQLLENVQKYKITTLVVVPPVVVMLSKRPESSKYDIRNLRQVFVVAAPLSKDLQREVSNRFNLVMTQGWGMTELTCTATLTPGRTNHPGSVGSLFPNTEVKLVDKDGKEVTEDGDEGEIIIRGPQVMLAYWNNDTATRDSLSSDGWYQTGDVAVVQNDMFKIADRKKELIKVNGLQVAPVELEAALLKLDAVADAAVVGTIVQDQECPRGYVVLQPAATGLVSEEDVQREVACHVAKHKRLTGGTAEGYGIDGDMEREVAKLLRQHDGTIYLSTKRKSRL